MFVQPNGDTTQFGRIVSVSPLVRGFVLVRQGPDQRHGIHQP